MEKCLTRVYLEAISPDQQVIIIILFISRFSTIEIYFCSAIYSSDPCLYICQSQEKYRNLKIHECLLSTRQHVWQYQYMEGLYPPFLSGVAIQGCQRALMGGFPGRIPVLLNMLHSSLILPNLLCSLVTTLTSDEQA